jgi:hypothetical protein
MTRLLVVAIAALVAVAAVDAVRSRETARQVPSPARSTQAQRPVPALGQLVAERLTELGARGVLVYSDVERDCALSALRLPTLVPEPAPRTPTCRFALSPDGSRILFDGGWRADGRLGFRCGGGVDAVDVVSGGGSDLYSLGARCPAAWSPDGRLAVVGSGGEIRTWRFPCGPPSSCSDVVVPLRALASVVDAAHRLAAPPRVDAIEVLALAWLSETKLAVTLEARWRFGAGAGPDAATVERFVAAFERRRLVFVRPDLGQGGFTELVASARGRFLAIATEDPEGVLVLTSAGGQVALPALPAARAFAWSPDERLLALATRASVYVVRLGGPAARVVRVPVRARDLAWIAGRDAG